MQFTLRVARLTQPFGFVRKQIDPAVDHAVAMMKLSNLHAAKGKFDAAIEMHRKLLSCLLSKLKYALQDYNEGVEASEVNDSRQPELVRY